MMEITDLLPEYLRDAGFKLYEEPGRVVELYYEGKSIGRWLATKAPILSFIEAAEAYAKEEGIKLLGMSTNPETQHRLGIGKQARVPFHKIKQLIDEVPDVNDPTGVNYWVEVDDELVYLEGWCDECLAGTGFPPIGGGEWDQKIEYMRDLTPSILERKAKERNLELIYGGFVEKTEEDYPEHLYGVTYGVYRKGGET